MCDEPPQPPKRKRFLSIREVADEIGISERSAWRLVEQGELPVHQFGASTRVKREDLDIYIENNRRRRGKRLDDDDDDSESPTDES
jgi:excisionase family DNA binding protein